jgi:hypothetical protein
MTAHNNTKREKSMNINDIMTRKGTIVTVTSQKEVKVKKGNAPITKLSVFQARLGVTYDNMKSVQEKREDGRLPEQNQGLPWGTWKDFPYIIEHNGKEYVRFSKVNSSVPAKTVFFRDGQEIPVDEVKRVALASEFSKSDLDCFNILADNIIDIKG